MPLFLPAEERREIIRQYAKAYDIKVLVETGTNQGDTPYDLRDDFEEIFTIELGDWNFDYSRNRLSPFTHIHCIKGDSAKKLPGVLNAFRGSAVFWLDGHYSGPGTARGSIDTPVQTELEVIFGDSRQHVILVDDARLFGGGEEHTEEFKDYPSLAWVETQANLAGYDYELKDDIIRLTPRG